MTVNAGRNVSEYVANLKKVIARIIAEFRGLLFLVPSEVKINSLKSIEGGYEVSGCYRYKALLGGVVIEEGSFKITLSREFEVLSVEITPKS